jgi:RNA-binding protein YhbY
MLVLVDFSGDAAIDPSGLAALAAEHELVLFCAHEAMTTSVIRHLRAVLPRHQIVTLLIADEVSRHERELVLEIIEDGRLPVIVSTHAATGPALSLDWFWLGADMHLVVSPAPSSA